MRAERDAQEAQLKLAAAQAKAEAQNARAYAAEERAKAAAAQDAVLQEDIPLGSRFFIKRYFESIRPKE